MGKYGTEKWEEVDRFDDRKEAAKMLNEYRMAYGAGWQLKIKRGS